MGRFALKLRIHISGYGCYIQVFGFRARYKSALHLLRTIKKGEAVRVFILCMYNATHIKHYSFLVCLQTRPLKPSPVAVPHLGSCLRAW